MSSGPVGAEGQLSEIEQPYQACYWYSGMERRIARLELYITIPFALMDPAPWPWMAPYQYVVQIAPRLFDANRGQPVHGLLVLMDKKRFFSCFVRIRLHLRIGLLVLGKVSAVPGGKGLPT